MQKKKASKALLFAPQVKVCGLTRIEEALECANAGADAIGLVFYPRSPRFLSQARAKAICRALPQNVKTIGVFVDADYTDIMQKVDHCNLKGVQLHGNESPQLVNRLRQKNLTVLKALFNTRTPKLSQAADYHPNAYLVECGRGALPGGNSRAWDWHQAQKIKSQTPVVLAGGLNASNVQQAIKDGQPAAVDVSSGVESRPGRKDIDKVFRFIRAANCSNTVPPATRIF